MADTDSDVDDAPPPPPPPRTPGQRVVIHAAGTGTERALTGPVALPLAFDSDDEDAPPPAHSPSPPPPPAPCNPSITVTLAHADGHHSRAQSSPGFGSLPAAAKSGLSAMLHQNRMLLGAGIAESGVGNEDSGDDDDEDEEEPSTPSSLASSSAGGQTKKLGSSPSGSHSEPPGGDVRWECEKANRYGLKDSRIVVLSLATHAVRFFDTKSKLKAEIPLNQIAATTRKGGPNGSKPSGEDARRVEMAFREERRSYELYFKTEEDAAMFERLCSAELDSSSMGGQATRGYSQSVARTLVPITPSAHGHGLHGHGGNATLPMPGKRGSLVLPSGAHTRAASASIATSVHSEVAYSNPLHPGNQVSAAGGAGGAGVDGAAPGGPSALLVAEDHNAYLDYPIIKKNRFGIRQTRILVINARLATLMLLDEKRKFKKEFALGSILEIEIPKMPSGGSSTEAQAFLVFQRESQQKPFHLFFADTLDRLHFCERIVSLAPQPISIKDENDNATHDASSLRFGVLKLNKVGVKKKRIVELRAAERVLRSFNDEKSYKDLPLAKVRRVEKPLLDRCRINIFLVDRPHPIILLFPDPVARERFVCQCNWIKSAIEEEALAALQAQAATTAGNNSASLVPKSINPPLSIFVGTWNLGNAGFTHESLSEFVPALKYDLYVLGLQECSKGCREQWLLELRACVQGQSKLSNAAAAAAAAASPATNGTHADGSASPSPSPSTPSSSSSSSSKSAPPASSSTSLEDDGDDQPYAVLGIVKLWEMVMMVLIRRPLLSKVSNVVANTIATGVGDVLGNKGGCGLSFTFQDTQMAFIACHLAARSERVHQRAENYMKLLRQLQLGLPNVDMLSQFEHVFWLGDLNYRTEGLEFSEVLQLVKQRDFKLLAQYDQLHAQMGKQLVFAGFNEGPLRFAPTYRWERKEQVFSNKKFQLPSWTDRVLWHSLPGLGDLTLESYGSAPNVMGSDHRPVFATFFLEVRAPYTAKLPSRVNVPIRVLSNTNANLVTRANASFISPLADPALTAAARLSASGGSGGGGSGSSSGGGSGSHPPPPGRAGTSPHSGSSQSTTPGKLGGNIAALQLKMSLQLPMGSPPPMGVSPLANASSPLGNSLAAGGASYKHFSLDSSPPSILSPSARPSLLINNSSGNGASTPGSTNEKDKSSSSSSAAPAAEAKKPAFALFPYTQPAASGPLFTPPVPTLAMRGQKAPVLGFTKDFSIVLQSVKISLAAAPRGDLTLTLSAPFLASWPSTPPVSYPFGQEVGCHYDEVLLAPFIHDLYYLYNRHLCIVVGVPSDHSNETQGNQEQTGAGTQVGTATVGLGTVCANIFAHLAALQEASPSKAAINPNAANLRNDQGAYYFIEPIYREGLYTGQLEGRIAFRYGSSAAK